MLQAGVKSPPISPLCPPPVQTVRILYHGAVSAGDAAALAHEIIQASKGERCHPENPEGNRHVSRSTSLADQRGRTAGPPSRRPALPPRSANLSSPGSSGTDKSHESQTERATSRERAGQF